MAINEKVTLGASLLRISLPVFAAQRDGLFLAQGLDVTLPTYETAQPLLEDVTDGRIDAGGFIAFPIILQAARYVADPPVVVAGVVEDASNRLSYTLARRGSGLSFPKDARGRRIGILPTIAYREWLEEILRAAKVPLEEVTIVPVAPLAQPGALATSEVDLLLTNDPIAIALLASKEAELVDGGPPCAQWLGDPFPFGTFALSAELVRARPAVAQRLVAAIDAGIESVRRDPVGARRALADMLPLAERAAVDSFPHTRYLTSQEAGAELLKSEIARQKALGHWLQAPRVSVWQAPHEG